MDVTRLRPLRGPNMWTRRTAFQAVVTCRDDEREIADVPALERRLRTILPSVPALQNPQRRGPVSLAHALEVVSLALQTDAGCPVTFSHTEETAQRGIFQVVVEYSEEAVGRAAFGHAEAVVLAALDADGRFDAAAAVAELRELEADLRLGPSTGCIVQAAVARGIPYRRLTEGSLVQFGWGRHQRRIWAAEVDATSAVSESIAQDKDLTKQLLRAAGVPVPFGRPVADLEDGWAAAQEVGLPVVVKPRDGNQGKGITVNVTRREQYEAAYESAVAVGDVMVEKFIPGSDFRLLVVGDRLVAAARRDPPRVVGDGRQTIRQLVDAINADPRRGDGHESSLTKVRLDDIAVALLATKGLTPDTVPEKGREVVLRKNANLSTGGTATDVTDEVHPEVAACAVLAAQTVGLHVCGVDLVCEDVSLPLDRQHGGIVEVNAAPGLRMHLSPSYGKGRAVGEAIVHHLFRPGENGRVPIVAVTGTNGKTTVTRLIAHLFATGGWRVGMTNTDGVWVEGRQTDSGDCAGPRSARNVLAHPDVDAAVFETARGGILREGLGFDRCQVAVVTNVGQGDHLGMNFIETPEDIARVKGVIVHNVAPDGYAVLNAADPLVAGMAARCPGKVIYFAADRHHPVMAAHRAQGRRCVHVEGDEIVATEGSWRAGVALRDIAITRHGTIGFQVENAMAAIAAAWAVGLSFDVVQRGLASFTSDTASVPGRFNVIEYRGATLVADYGHNPDAMRALVAAVEAMPARRRSVVISAAGDRRDEDIREQTRILGAAFDDIILYQDAAQRGRADGEVLALLREGLQGAPRARDVVEIRGEFAAIDHALGRLGPGDLSLILVDQVQEALDHLAKRVEESLSGASG
jgi:cyanophycin synthetase